MMSRSNLQCKEVLFVLFFMHAMISPALAQFSIDMQLRPRLEVRDGYQKLSGTGADPALLVTQRTRLSLAYENSRLKIKLTPQDVRVWGDDVNMGLSGSNGNEASLDLYEGYAEVNLAGDNWLSIGRQEWVYDNQSILSNGNWNQNGVSSDALLFKLKFKKWNMHVGGSWNTMKQVSSGNLYHAGRYKTLDFLWVNRPLGDKWSASLIHVVSGRTKNDTSATLYIRQTSGYYVRCNTEYFNLWSDGYFQYGKSNTGKDVRAFLAEIEASYRFGKLTAGMGFCYISGNNRSASDISTDLLYDPLYRSRHTFNGYMDYYTSYSQHTAGGGLADSYALIKILPSSKWLIRNAFHVFLLGVTNPGTPSDHNLGYENDLVLSYKFAGWGSVESGYLCYIPTRSLKTIQGIPGGRFSQFGYVQLTLTPTLFRYQSQ